MTVKQHEYVAQGVLFVSSLLSHILMGIVIYCIYNKINMEGISFIFSTFIIGLMSYSIVLLRNPVLENVKGERMTIHEKIVYREAQTIFNIFIAAIYLVILTMLVYRGYEIASVSEMYVAYYGAILCKEGYSVFSKPTAYTDTGMRVKYYTKPGSDTAIEGGRDLNQYTDEADDINNGLDDEDESTDDSVNRSKGFTY